LKSKKGGDSLPLIAHSCPDGRTQPFSAHAGSVASLASQYAAAFGAEEPAYLLGLLHDVGKCSPAGQNRLLNNGAKVEHSAAGAEAICEQNQNNPFAKLLSYCIAGHHSGLPNGGVPTDTEDRPTLTAKLKRQKVRNHDYAAFAGELGMIPSVQPFALVCSPSSAGFTYAFRTRMLFSCLVDADYLDTEAFMNDAPLRKSAADPLDVLLARLQDKLQKFGPPKNLVGEKRAEVLADCLSAAAAARGLYTLTVPTGGGKTLSSLAFALRHAIKNGLDRVIYVIPYTSIIDQTAAVFREVLGEQNVLEHHHNANYDTPDEEETDPRALAMENWDAPIVVTTNVQFFESLFSNRTSRCRKLHNITNSVVIFDEAQMLPIDLLLPCVRSIEELVRNHRCTAVLCSATQPALEPYFDAAVRPREICRAPAELYEALRRVRYEPLGQIDDESLLARLNAQKQVLCVVNTKIQAQELFGGLTGEGCYHLSTFMTPTHRRRVLAEIRIRLDPNRTDRPPCRVISTSLIEAGVNVDFPVVYREEAGLDSAIQAAGRCNREGRLSSEEAVVYLFRPDERYQNKRPRSLRLPIETARLVMQNYTDISAPEAIRDYFTRYFRFRGESLDQKNIIRQLNNGVSARLNIPFATVAEQFRVIDSPTRMVLVPENDEARALIAALQRGERSRTLLRQTGLHAVSVYQQQYDLLLGSGALDVLDGELAALHDMALYSNDTGLQIPNNGIAVFV
jgi:CRISPR-associated endonuclease/helicase Cas3